MSILGFLMFQFLLAQEYSYHYVDDIKFLRQDKYGFLYLVSNQSICKYDGKEMHNTCLHLDAPINDVVVSSENEYYIAIANTFYVYKNQNKVFEHLLNETITCLQVTENHVLIGTLGAGLYQYSLVDETLSKLEVKGSINDIINIGSTSFVITDTELLKIDSISIIRKTVKLPELLPKQIVSYDVDKLAILMNDGKVLFANPNLEITNTYQSTDFKPLEITGKNGLLYAIDNHHLKQWEAGAFNVLKTGDFENLIQVQSSLFTTHKNTIDSYNILSTFYDLDKVFSVLPDNNQFWLGREGKISLFSKSQIINDIKFPEPYKNAYVSSLVRNGNKIYAGTMGNGVLVFDAEKGSFLEAFKNLDSNPNEQNIIKLKIIDNQLWVGYLNGLKVFYLDNNQLKHDFTNLLENNYLYGFYVNSDDDFYLGTSDNGLIHIKNGQPKYFFKGSSVYSIVETPQGIVFSVEGQGVYLLKDGETIKLSDSYFFRSHDFYNMLYVNGNIVFSHDHGVDVLNLDKGQISYLSNEKLNEPHLNANAVNDSYGLVVYDNGIYALRYKLLEDITEDNLILSTPLLFDKEIETNQKKFPYKDNVWTFLFETLNYYAPNERNYKYRLTPLETDWKHTTQEKVTYYNLPPGDYTFEVSTGGHRNFNPKQTKQFSFIITKPFWMLYWFWLLALCVLILSVYFVVKYREKEIIKKEQLKSVQLQFEYQRIKDQINPHFLFNSFNSLIGLVEENPSKATEVLQKLSSMFRTVLKYEKANIISVSEELELASQYFETHKIRYQDLITLDIHSIDHADKKFVIPMSLQLLIENAIKHNIINTNSKLKITIVDDGHYLVFSNNLNKKNKNALSLGLGLENLIKRNDMILNKKPIIEQTKGFFTVKIPYIYE